MKVCTNTPPRARRRGAPWSNCCSREHNGDCQTCDRNEDCELQALAAELGIREIAYAGEKTRKRIDASTPALLRDNGKCIKCRRCVSVCVRNAGRRRAVPAEPRLRDGDRPGLQPRPGRPWPACSAASARPSARSGPSPKRTRSTRCGRPWTSPASTSIVQTAPAIRAALGECFGYPPGTLVTGKMVAALRRLGFHAVFDTNFAADLTILEEGTELLDAAPQGAWSTSSRWPCPCSPVARRAGSSSWSTSIPTCCPTSRPASRRSRCSGPWPRPITPHKLGKRPEDIFVVSIMPCTAKKFECQRPEMDASGVRDVDVVLTTRELGKMIHAAGIDFDSLPDERDGRPAGPLHRRGRHLRQHRRRDGSRPAHGLRNRHRPRRCRSTTCTSPPSKACRASRRPR